MKKSVKITSIVVVVVAMLFVAAALGIKPLSDLHYASDAAYPLLVAVLSLIFAIWIVFDERAKAKKEVKSGVSGDAADSKTFDRDILVTISLIILYGALLIWLGYIISTLVFTTLAVTYLYKGGFKFGLLVGFMATFIIVLVFKYGFSVILP